MEEERYFLRGALDMLKFQCEIGIKTACENEEEILRGFYLGMESAYKIISKRIDNIMMELNKEA